MGRRICDYRAAAGGDAGCGDAARGRAVGGDGDRRGAAGRVAGVRGAHGGGAGMRGRGRVWRVGKWVGLGLAVLSTVVFLASRSNLFQMRMASGECFMLAGGEFIFVDYSKSSNEGNPAWRGPIGFSIRSDTFFWGLHF